MIVFRLRVIGEVASIWTGQAGLVHAYFPGCERTQMKIKVLIAEDEALLALSYKMGLEMRGCEVVGIAYTGDQAITMAKTTQPEIVLMDIKLTGWMDGVDAARQINERFGVPIIYITGHGDKHTKNRALNTDHLLYLEKPVESTELCGIIKDALSSIE